MAQGHAVGVVLDERGSVGGTGESDDSKASALDGLESGVLPVCLAALTVQGKSVSIPTGFFAYAAIDTGMTFVGGPASAIQNIYAQIPGSAVGRVLHISCAFPLSGTKRLVTYGQSGVVGDTFSGSSTVVPSLFRDADAILVAFQNNVYSVFRCNPPAAGFAQLSAPTLAMNGVNGNPPSATIGSVSASVTAGVGGIT